MRCGSKMQKKYARAAFAPQALQTFASPPPQYFPQQQQPFFSPPPYHPPPPQFQQPQQPQQQPPAGGGGGGGGGAGGGGGGGASNDNDPIHIRKTGLHQPISGSVVGMNTTHALTHQKADCKVNGCSGKHMKWECPSFHFTTTGKVMPGFD
jgi:hypothetical protein